MGKHSNWFEEYSNDGYRKSLEGCTRDKIVNLLTEFDNVRSGGSWRDEDPNVGPTPEGKVDPVRRTLDDIDSKKAGNQATFRLMAIQRQAPPELQKYDTRAGQPILQFVTEEPLTDGLIRAYEFRLTKLESRTDCEVEDISNGDTWKFHAEVNKILPAKVNLKDVQFTLTNLTSNTTYKGCRLLLHGYRTLGTM